MAKKVVIVLAQGFEEIEAVVCIDLLRRVEIEVVIASLKDLKVKGAHGIEIMAEKKIDSLSKDFDACIFPGGLPGASNLASCQEVKNMIKEMNAKGKIIAAICASPAFVLAPLGILDGKTATTYEGTQDMFTDKVKFSRDLVVVDGNIITSRSPATAILFALTIVEKLLGKEAMEKNKKGLLLS